MTRVAVFALVCLPLFPSILGCMMPVGVEADRAASAVYRQPSPKPTPVHEKSFDTGPVSYLRVNSETISAEELWRDVRQELSDRAGILGPDDYRSYVDRLAARLITDRIAEMLLFQHASLRLPPEADKNIDKYVDGEIRKIITTKHNGVQRLYDKHLAERGLTIDDIHERLRREIIIASYLEREIKPKVAEPTRAELYAIFEASRHQLRQPTRRKMSLIDVRVLEYLPKGVNNPTREEYDAARAEARSVIRAVELELRNGADFAELARRHSHGLHAAEGGSWGSVEKGSVRERFEPAVDALFKLGEGEVSGVIETTDGLFLVRCDELQPAVEPEFQDIQPEIKEQHFRALYNRLIAELVQDLRRKARIEPVNLERFHAAATDVIGD